MFLSISDDAFFTCIGIAVDTEMTTSIIHADDLATIVLQLASNIIVACEYTELIRILIVSFELLTEEPKLLTFCCCAKVSDSEC